MVRTHLKISNLQGLKSILLRQPETWDPLLQCSHRDTPLLEQWNIKKFYGTKNACMCSWGKFWTPKIQRDQTIQLPLLKNLDQKLGVGEKAGCCSCPMEKTPLKGWADHLSRPSSLIPGHSPILSPYKEQVAPSWGVSEQGNLLVVLTLQCHSRGPNKALPEFLVWPLINFYWLGKAKNPLS